MIGYYAHHQGAGHLTRMQSIAAVLDEPVWGLSSAACPPGWAGGWTTLARDDEPWPEDVADRDVTAHGALHWVPQHHDGLARRAAQLTAWAADERPRALVVDVSVEVTLLARLCGVPCVVVAMPGHRDDRAHRLAYDTADALLAPWPRGAHDLHWPDRWLDKAWFVGGISRFDGREAVPAPGRVVHDGSKGGAVLLLWGAGGRSTTDADVRAAQDATPGWSWVERSAATAGSPDLWDDLQRADVVVSHAGQNAVAEIAAARRPAVIVAQPRPHAEQESTACRIDDWRIAVGRSAWPEADAWPALLDLALARGGHGWSRWSDGDGARQVAGHLAQLTAAPVGP
ncbi:MAG: glycosyltransferase [Pedococcus sp.]